MPGGASRIWVIGSPGVGKSTLARALAADLDCSHVELDRLFWLPGWKRAPEHSFRAALAAATDGPRWVVDGQYEVGHQVLRERADLVVWLDPPLAVSFGRLVRRTWRRLVSRETLWSGNRESLRGAVELLTWALCEHRRVRRCNGELRDAAIRDGVPFLWVRAADVRATGILDALAASEQA